MRYKEGPKRSFRPNEWYLNQKVHSETDKFFSGSKGGVPNNPENANSFRPISAPINPQESMSGDFVKRKNPYGDAEQITEGEGPILVRPNQRGSSFDPPPRRAAQHSQHARKSHSGGCRFCRNFKKAWAGNRSSRTAMDP